MSHAHLPDDAADHPIPEGQRVPKDDRNAKKECERLLDGELEDTFPASDPPSWTLGGSHVSRLRK